MTIEEYKKIIENNIYYHPSLETMVEGRKLSVIKKFNEDKDKNKLIIKFGANSDYPTQIISSLVVPSDLFNYIKIDGVIYKDFTNTYKFDTSGEHIVEYSLKNNKIIDSKSFRGCSGITSVVIPDSVTTIGLEAFYNCTNLTSVTIPDSVHTIADRAFTRCKLNSLVIPDSVTTIGSEAFRSNNIGSINIPKSVVSITNSSFDMNVSLLTITVDNDNPIYNSINNCNAIIETATNTLVLGCMNTIIPDTVTTIGINAFRGCGSINFTSITIPDSVTNIKETSFAGCLNLLSIVMGTSVTNIEADAFNNTPSLNSITSLATVAATISTSSFSSSGRTGVLYIKEGSSGYGTWINLLKESSNNWTIEYIHEYVDLGLPSGTLWATMNVGANSETDYGNYYQYGKGAAQYAATSELSDYSGTENPLDSSIDTAAQVWGGSWHMPTRAQMQELTANTTYEWVTDYNGSGINGGLFTAQNGNSVFFPAAGYWNNGSQRNVGDFGDYWGSSPLGSGYAYYLNFERGNKDVGNSSRKSGFSVRPVIG